MRSVYDFRPIAHGVENGDEACALVGEAVFHFRRDLRVLLADNQPVCFQLFQRFAQHFVGYVAERAFQLTVSEHRIFFQPIQNNQLVFSGENFRYIRIRVRLFSCLPGCILAWFLLFSLFW